MTNNDETTGNVGATIALVVGLALLGGGAYLAMTGGEVIVVVILVLIGASALSGWVKARSKKS